MEWDASEGFRRPWRNNKKAAPKGRPLNQRKKNLLLVHLQEHLRSAVELYVFTSRRDYRTGGAV